MNKFYLSMLFAFLCGSVFLSCKKEKNEAPIKTEQTEAIESSEDEAKAEDEDDVAYIEDEDEEDNQKKDGNMYQDGNWYYHTYEDPMTDEKSFNAGCESKESQDICGKRTTLHLVLMHIKDYDVVILGIDGGVLRQDRLPLAYVRFDGGEIEKYSVMADGAHEQYIVDVNKFIKHLKQSKKCAITVEAQDGGRATYTFDTAGLKWNYNGGKSSSRESYHREEAEACDMEAETVAAEEPVEDACDAVMEAPEDCTCEEASDAAW